MISPIVQSIEIPDPSGTTVVQINFYEGGGVWITVAHGDDRDAFARFWGVTFPVDDACADDPDGLHHAGCGCEEVPA